MSDTNLQKDQINLLWTGGSDSTFQLLQLLLVYRSPVLPFYLIHVERGSTSMEIKAMKEIKNLIIKKYPHTKELLLPTQYHEVTDILPNAEITSAYESILNFTHIGNQYHWLARFCKEKKIKDMQLSVERPIKSKENDWDAVLDKMLIKDVINSQSVYRFDSKNKNSDIFKMFKYFVLPIRKFTKVQINEISIEKGWEKIMDKTWFCHNPTRNKKPCGICSPCQQKINSGLGRKVPLIQHVKFLYYSKILWPFKALTKSILIQFGLFSKKNNRL